jgi:hypothetical protein
MIMSDTHRQPKAEPAERPFAYVRQCCDSPDHGMPHSGAGALDCARLHIPPRPDTETAQRAYAARIAATEPRHAARILRRLADRAAVPSDFCAYTDTDWTAGR